MNKLATVSIIEDDKHYREGLAELIDNSNSFVVLNSYPTAEQALSHIPKQIPDIAIVDIKLPGMNGVELIYKIKTIAPDIKCIVCSFYDDNEYVFNALRNGASGYILKDSQPQEILNSLEELQKGGSPMSRYIAKKVIQTFRERVNNSPKLNELSDRENEILLLLSQGESTKEIINGLGITQNTLSKHLQNIYSKLHVTNKMDALKRLKNQTEPANTDQIEMPQNQFKLTSEVLIQFLKLYIAQTQFISHDLRRSKFALQNALNNILTLLQNKTEDNELKKVIELVNYAITESKLINPLAYSVSHVSNFTGYKEYNSKEPLLYCNLQDIIADIKQQYTDLQIEVSKSNVDFIFLYPYPIMQSIFFELIKNAKKEAKRNCKVLIKWQIIDKKLQCEIHDDGNGFSGLQVRKFENYSNIQPLLSEKSGVGLKLITKIMSDSNGSILFSKSDILNGALVYFEIPLVDFSYKSPS